ncbi:Endonuclease/Exonuclease/phosphatase family protein [Poriferisphaera corsica]|uniref:Endonuclease/Exonuclease/phosphatase family protein n=1 Tax=Poriferisphaera corsica TaxID=2528020 RepID=A0A517YQZ2_9BACT|nr:endonuclease/exonuclease/phosphatase family protein [Poriferisphaera corsica]QDU32634.1 Endonuclease/Exonuclease/phosphatase family protein [Poriferisphaera corsica]
MNSPDEPIGSSGEEERVEGGEGEVASERHSAVGGVIRRLWGVVSGVVLLIGIGAMLGTILGLGNRYNHILDLMSNFRLIYAEILVLSVIVMGLRQRWFWSSLMLLCLLINLGFIAPLYLPAAKSVANATVEEGARGLRLLHVNVHNRNMDYEQVGKLMEESDADLIFLQEVNTWWLMNLEGYFEGYDLHTPRPRSDAFGIAMFVKRGQSDEFKLIDAGLADMTGGYNIPAIEATVRVQGQTYSVLSLHTLPPIVPMDVRTWAGSYASVRNEQLVRAFEWARNQPFPPVLIGDLNATPFSHPLSELMNPEGEVPVLVYSQQGWGYAGTWPAQFPSWLRLPLDHCLVSPKLSAVDRRLGPQIGSDHLPLYVEILPLERMNERLPPLPGR